MADALLAAHSPTAQWPLRTLLDLGPLSEAPTLERLRAAPHEAGTPDPEPPNLDPRRRRPMPYPLHHACRAACPPAVIRRLIELCPEAVRKRNSRGEYPIHIASYSASALTQGVSGANYRRAEPAAVVVQNAAACVKLLLEAWPRGALACDDFRKSVDDCGYWPMHTAMERRAPPPFLDELRTQTPCDAFANPIERRPPRRFATKTSEGECVRSDAPPSSPTSSGTSAPAHAASPQASSWSSITATTTAWARWSRRTSWMCPARIRRLCATRTKTTTTRTRTRTQECQDPCRLRRWLVVDTPLSNEQCGSCVMCVVCVSCALELRGAVLYTTKRASAHTV